MNYDNRFIKLMTVTVEERELLLYGFSAPTNQERRDWKKKRDKRKLNVSSAILSPEEVECFEHRLTESEDIAVGEIMLSAPELVARSPVLSYNEGMKRPAPVSRLHCVHELWNTWKEGLVKQTQAALGSQGKQLYLDTKTLLAQMKEECGVDFAQQGSRFGNYEHYDRPELYCELEIRFDKESEGKQVTVKKPADWNRPLLVSCAAERNGRFLFHQIRDLGAEDASIGFAAEEPISRCTVYAWDQQSGQLVYSKTGSPCGQFLFTFSSKQTPRIVQDPWSQSLRSAAANRSETIRQQIESVQRYTSDRPVRTGGGDLISAAAGSGEQLLAPYRNEPCRGAFIPDEQKNGEIGSFLKIQEYLKQNGVCCAVIADPYFSVPTAAKMLSRIENADLELSIVTSLASTDPDTGEKRDVTEQYRQFLRDNAGALHEKLYLCNLRRGKDPVFHDRYLIRYYSDGRIDGFLLSNSLNSMGEFYPFVIAPMEPEVCRSVIEYLDQLQDAQVQAKRPRRLRIACDVLFDYRERPCPAAEPPKDLAGQAWLSQWPERRIPTNELSDALCAVWSHWTEEPEEVCRVLGLLGGHVHDWSASDLAALFQKEQREGYMDRFSAMAKSIEQSRRQYGAGVDSQEYEFWSLLAGKAQPQRGGFGELLDYHHPVYYSGFGWLIGGYHLLLKLNADRFVKLLDETCSPLMFSCLTEELGLGTWLEALYHSLLGSQKDCVRLLAVHWPGVLLERKSLEPDAFFPVLDALRPDDRLLQAARLLSKAAFQMRCSKATRDLWEKMVPRLAACIAAALPLCTPEGRETALYWLYDCEKGSCCALHLEVAVQTQDTAIRENLLDRAIELMRDSLTGDCYGSDVSWYIELYLEGLDLRWEDQAEQKMLKGGPVDWDIFETAVEPVLKDYDYSRWRKAYDRACRQILLLKAYRARHPEGRDTAEWLDMWEKRVEAVEH